MVTRVLTADADYRAELADALEVFGARVSAAQAATAWAGPSPCPGWTAADVVRHVTGSLYAFVNAMGGNGSGGAPGQQAEGAEHLREQQRVGVAGADECMQAGLLEDLGQQVLVVGVPAQVEDAGGGPVVGEVVEQAADARIGAVDEEAERERLHGQQAGPCAAQQALTGQERSVGSHDLTDGRGPGGGS